MEDKKIARSTLAMSNEHTTTTINSVTQNREYYKLGELDNERFLIIPWSLFTNYKDMSNTAKLVYALLRDRLHLSQKNKWSDEKGVFLIFKQTNLAEILNISLRKCTQAIKELQKFGLIETVRQGLGKPNKVYLLKCKANSTDVFKPNIRCAENALQETQNMHDGSAESARQKCKICVSDVQNLHTSNTDISNTKLSNTEERAAAIAADTQQTCNFCTSEHQKTNELTLIVNAFQNNIHLISSEIEKDTLVDLVKTYSANWVLEAIKEAARSSGKTVKYIEKILQRWSTLNSAEPWLIKKTQTQYNKAEATRQAAKDAVTELLEEFRREDEAQK